MHDKDKQQYVDVKSTGTTEADEMWRCSQNPTQSAVCLYVACVKRVQSELRHDRKHPQHCLI